MAWPRIMAGPSGLGWNFARSIGITGLRRLARGGPAQHPDLSSRLRMYGLWIDLFVGRRNASQQSPGPEKAKVLKVERYCGLVLGRHSRIHDRERRVGRRGPG